MTKLIAGVAIVLMMLGLMGSTYASYTGLGLAGNPTYSIRQGSVWGIGGSGGPGSGK
jgi:hypothetical protein